MASLHRQTQPHTDQPFLTYRKATRDGLATSHHHRPPWNSRGPLHSHDWWYQQKHQRIVHTPEELACPHPPQ